MENILTLIATPPLPPITAAHVSAALAALGPHAGPPAVLAQGVAIDVPFTSLTPAAATAAVKAALGAARVDVVAQPLANRQKRLLLADMDSTIVQQESLDELAEEAGIKAEIAAITEAAMRGELDFVGAVKARVAKLKGLPVPALERALARLTLMPGAEVLIKTMQAHGATCHLVSGGFQSFTAPIAQRVGFTTQQGNVLVIENGSLTGEVQEPILDKATKVKALHQYAAAHNVPLAATMAVGDGANDIPMLQAAGLGVAFRAKPAVVAAAPAAILHSDLSALLYLQGLQP